MAGEASVKRACEGVLPACQYEEATGATPIRPFLATLAELEKTTDGQLLTDWRVLQDRGAIFERHCSRCPVLNADQIAEGAALLALARSAVAANAPAGNPLFSGAATHASAALETERRMLRQARAARLRVEGASGRDRTTALAALDPARASKRLAERVAKGEIPAPVARGLTQAYERAAKGLETALASERATLDAAPKGRSAADARHDELTYLSKFQQRVRGLPTMTDPRIGRAWRVVSIEEQHEDAEGERPVGATSRFVLFARSWWLFGAPRPKLVAEARTLARPERYASEGADDEPFALADINRVLDAERGRRGPFRALALVSLTGWTDDAIARVRRGWDDPSLFLLLVDARTGDVHAHDALRASHDALVRLFVPETRAEEAKRATIAIRDALLLAVHDEVGARDVAKASGMTPAAIDAAMLALANEGWGSVEKRKDGVAFRRREGKDLGELS